jgi:hypothetical protein
MKANKSMKTIINISYPAFALFAFACFVLSPQARAVCQEGCFTNQNTALGEDALLHNIEDNNTAVGFNALRTNTTGTVDTAIGASALLNNTSGFNNTAVGFSVLEFNTTGGGNTAIGVQALGLNTFGNSNTANGGYALYSNTTGDTNTATGFDTLLNSTTGNGNTATGFNALSNNTSGNNNIALGAQAGTNLTTGSSNIDIGNNGVAGDSKTIRIGKRGLQTATYIAAISGATVPTGVAVIIDTTGHLGTTTSSARFKDEIKPMDKTSESILALKPVTFRYKHDLDPDGIPQFGLVAEDVDKVNPDLVARDEQGKPYTVRYDAVNAMLLNEFIKEHRTVQELKSNAAKQEATIANQQKQIEALTAGLQKVSAQLELSKAAPQTVLNE